MTASEDTIFQKLALRYPKQEWALLRQVRAGTGWRRDPTYADAIALNLWPSRGMELHGFEFKASRSDWVRELKQPRKAEMIFGYCDRWWIVTSERTIVRKGELPPTWGLLVPAKAGEGFSVRVAAPKLKPKLLDRGFIAALLRRLVLETPDAIMEKVKSDSYHEGYCKGVASEQRNKHQQMESFQANVDRLQKRIAEFETASGVHIDSWDRGQIGEAVRIVVRGDILTYFERCQKLIDEQVSSLTNASTSNKTALEQLQKLRRPKVKRS